MVPTMCLIAFAYRMHPAFELLVIANRDEFFARPTAPLAAWADAPDVLGGRDLQAGGSWLGVTASGRFAAVTNFREPHLPRPGARSRGSLVGAFLAGATPPASYMKSLAARAPSYPGFNLLAGDRTGLWYLTNRGAEPRAVEPGLHALSNHALDTDWPKVATSRARLGAAIEGGRIPTDDELFAILADDAPVEDLLLPDTGVGLERERALAPVFIRTPDYGTRSSTLVFIGAESGVRIVERSSADGSVRSFVA